MIRVFFLLLAVVAAVDTAHAAPRGRRTRYYSTVPTQQYTSSNSYAAGTAQGVAELQAQNCSVGHHGGNSGYEGVGSGFTPDQALGNCCYSNSGMSVVDQGVARGKDGRWYACKRYR